MTVRSREVYQHFRGGLYEVLIPDAIDAETEQPVVIYRSLQTGQVWSRPLGVFFEGVESQGQQVPRFQKASLPEEQDRPTVGDRLDWQTVGGHTFAQVATPPPPTAG